MKLALLSSCNYPKFDICFSMEALIRFFPSVYLNNLIYALCKSSVDNESNITEPLYTDTFIHQPVPMLEITGQQSKFSKKKFLGSIYFTPLEPFMGQN